MGKKVKKGGISTASDVVEAPTIDLKTLIHDHAHFFDKLIELVPAKFYLPVDEDSKPWVQGLSKVKKATLKQQTRENIKQSRRDRLDPEKAQTTTLDLLKKSIDKAENDNKDSDDDEEEEIEIKVKPMTNFDGETSKSDKSVTYEELQQRLHHKLEMLRSNRGQGKRTMMMNEVRQRPDFTDKKRKREDRDNSNSGKTASGSGKDKSKEKIEPDFRLKVKVGGEDGSRKKRFQSKELERSSEKEKEKCGGGF